MKCLLLLVALVGPLSALQCIKYATVLHGDMDAVDSQIFKDRSKLDVVETKTCAEGYACEGDANFFTLEDGTTAGFVYTDCFKPRKIEPQNCGWNRKNSTGSHKGYEDVYRCVCDNDDFCQTPAHLIEQFKFAYSDRLDACERLHGKGWKVQKQEDGTTECINTKSLV